MELGFAIEFTNSQNDTVGGTPVEKCHLNYPLVTVFGKTIYYCIECQKATVEVAGGKEVLKEKVIAEQENVMEKKAFEPGKSSTVSLDFSSETDGFGSGFGLDFGASTTSESKAESNSKEDLTYLLKNRTISSKKTPSKRKKKPTGFTFNIEYEIEYLPQESLTYEQSLAKQYFSSNPTIEPSKDWAEEYETDPQKYSLKFQKIVSFYPSQILRYEKCGTALWFQSPKEIPNCQKCKKERVFEFQIMPNLINLFCKEKPEMLFLLDFVTILVFCCPDCDDSIAIIEKEV